MFKILDEACVPKRGTKYSAYIDLFSREDIVIGAGETKVIPLGVKIDLDFFRNLYRMDCIKLRMFLKSHYLEVALRSSLAVKGLIIANGIGIIDLDYPDEIGVIVHYPVKAIYSPHSGNLEIPSIDFIISKGDKVAQCTLKEHKGYLMGYESDVVRDGGYGSTGK